MKGEKRENLPVPFFMKTCLSPFLSTGKKYEGRKARKLACPLFYRQGKNMKGKKRENLPVPFFLLLLLL